MSKKQSVIFYSLIVLAGVLAAVIFVNAQESTTTTPTVCIEVIAPAQNPEGTICREFPTPCDVPQGWTRVEKCPARPVPPIVEGIPEKELKQELSIKEIRGRIICLELGVCGGPFGEAKPTNEVIIKAAKVIEIGSGSLKISVFGYSYKINITGSKLVRKLWNTSEIDEFSVGDLVNVAGSLDASDNYLVHATTVRNISIQRNQNVFKGVVSEISSSTNSFVLKTEEKDNQTVVVSPSTKIVKSESIVCIQAPCPPIQAVGSFADIQAGSKLIVRGLWDKNASKIQAQLIVIGSESDTRPFFQKGEGFFQNLMQKGDGVYKNSVSGIKDRIEELQNKVKEMMERLKIINP